MKNHTFDLMLDPGTSSAGGAGEGGGSNPMGGEVGPMGGSNPLGGDDQSAVLATLQGGVAGGGSDPLGGDDGAHLDQGEDPMGSDGQAAAAPVAKPVPPGVKRPPKLQDAATQAPAKSTEQPAGEQISFADLEDAQQRTLRGVFTLKQINATLNKFGQAGLEHLLEQAELEYDDDEGAGSAVPPADDTVQVLTGDEQEEEQQVPEGWQDGDAAQEAPPAERPTQRTAELGQQPRRTDGQFAPISPSQETMQALKDVMGEGPVKQIFEPMIRNLTAATQRVQKQEQTLTGLIEHVNKVSKGLSDYNTHMSLDRLSEPALGTSYEGLTKQNIALRTKVVEKALERIRNVPGVSPHQALQWAVNKVTRAGASKAQPGQRPAPNAQQAIQRNRQTGSVPTRVAGGATGRAQQGAAPPQGLNAVYDILTRGLPTMRATGA